MSNNIPNFNMNFFDKYTDIYKISVLTSFTEADIEKIISAGFVFNFTSNSFFSNIIILNKTYNMMIKYYDSNYRLYIKNEKDNYTENTKYFVAKKTASISNGNTTIYTFNIDLMFIGLQEWIKNMEFTSIKNILTSKITGTSNVELFYKTDKFEITKISKLYLYTKLPNGNAKTYDINMANISTEDLLAIDKQLEIAIKEVESTKNKSFKTFVNQEKNDIHNIHSLNE